MAVEIRGGFKTQYFWDVKNKRIRYIEQLDQLGQPDPKYPDIFVRRYDKGWAPEVHLQLGCYDIEETPRLSEEGELLVEKSQERVDEILGRVGYLQAKEEWSKRVQKGVVNSPLIYCFETHRVESFYHYLHDRYKHFMYCDFVIAKSEGDKLKLVGVMLKEEHAFGGHWGFDVNMEGYEFIKECLALVIKNEQQENDAKERLKWIETLSKGWL